jgi:hypothetical protein
MPIYTSGSFPVLSTKPCIVDRRDLILPVRFEGLDSKKIEHAECAWFGFGKTQTVVQPWVPAKFHENGVTTTWPWRRQSHSLGG